MDFLCAGSDELFEQNKVLHVTECCVLAPNSMGPHRSYKFVGDTFTYGNIVANIEALHKFWPNVKTYAQVQADDGSIPIVGPILANVGKKYGITRVGDVVPYTMEAVDFTPVAMKLSQMSGYDCIIQTGGIAVHIGGIIKQLRALGNTTLYGYSMGVDGHEIINIAGAAAATNLFGTKTTVDYPDNTPLIKELVSAKEAKYGPGVSVIYMGRANSLYMLVKAMEAAQSLDPTVVRDTWQSMTSIDTLYGPGTMGGEQVYGIKGHQAVHPVPIQVVQDAKVSGLGFVDITIP